MRHVLMMGARDPVMYRLVPTLVRQMGTAYPELVRAEPLIGETLRLGGDRASGRRWSADCICSVRRRHGWAIGSRCLARWRSGCTTRFGFPLDLTQDALREQGREVDLAGFETAMDEQRARARAAWAGSGEAATERVWFELKQSVGATEFLGYSTEAAEAEIVALVVHGAPVDAGRRRARSPSC